MSKSVACVAVVLGLASVAPAAAAPFTNGGFEQPGIAGAVQLTAGSTFLPGWTVVDATPGGDNEVQYTNSAAYGSVGVVASEGVAFLDLTGSVGRGKGVKSDAIDTVAGSRYRVGFDVGAFFVRGAGSFGDATVDVLLNDALVGSFTNTMDLLGPGSDWRRFTYDFVAVGPTARLTFLSSTSTTSSNLGVGLDNVTFGAVAPSPGSAAPEPAAWAVTITGFGLAGARLRRRLRTA